MANLCTDSTCTGAATVLLGKGDGTFQPSLTYASGGYEADSVAIADINGDGKLDLLLANTCFSGMCPNGEVAALLGNGDGTFQMARTYATGGTYARSVALADVNGDGHADALVANGVVSVLWNATAPNVTKTLVTTSGSPSLLGQPVTFTAAENAGVPDGETITFHDGTVVIGTGKTTNRVATFSTSALKVGGHSIKAVYPGDASFQPSSGAVKQVVELYSTTTALTSSLNPSTHGQAVTFTATVTPTGPNQPTGKVTFKDGTLGIGSATLNGGVATLVKSTLAVGTHPITATYQGDASSAKSTSAVLNQVVN
jgi:hypothetical protein